MNKEELVQEIAHKTSASQKQVSDMLNAMIDTVQTQVARGDKVTLVGFGTFESRKRSARTGRNPKTGAALQISAKTVPIFTAGKKFKDEVATR